MNEHRKPNANKLIDVIDLPQDLFLGLPNLTMVGNREIYISNHRGILSFAQEEIIILAKEFQIVVKGKNLNINSYSKEELTIKGYISSLGFI